MSCEAHCSELETFQTKSSRGSTTLGDLCIDVSAIQLRSWELTPSFARTYLEEVGRKIPA